MCTPFTLGRTPMKKYLKSIFIIGILIVGGGGIGWWLKPTAWERYLKEKADQSPRPFIVDALASLPSPFAGAIALDMGCGVGNETLLLLQKGYRVFAVDNQEFAFDILHKNPKLISYGDQLTPLVVSFEDFPPYPLPKVEMIVASYSLPYCNPHQFNKFWENLVRQLKEGGYFIGHTFDPGFTAFSKKDQQQMTFHTRAQTLALFKEFDILHFKEVQHPGLAAGTFDHFYEIVARKKGGRAIF